VKNLSLNKFKIENKVIFNFIFAGEKIIRLGENIKELNLLEKSY